MTNLFVLGNGFDLAHGLKTSYNDFRDFFQLKHPELDPDVLIEPNGFQQPDGEIRYDDEEVISMLFYLISEAERDPEKWSDVETSLGSLSFSLVLDNYEEHYDKEGDLDVSRNYNMYDDVTANLVIPTTSIQSLFIEWVNSIRLDTIEAKDDFQQLIGDDNRFLTFNYTDTLQMVYDIPDFDICHIHGRQMEFIHFGHGSKLDRTDEYEGTYFGSQDNLSKINRKLRKKTDEALSDNIDFFDEVGEAGIQNIYSYGFSFSDVDTIYLEELCNRIDTEKVIWHFNDYDNYAHDRYKTLLKECGFKGQFTTFHIS